MPAIPRSHVALALLAALPACGFEADYAGGTYACSDGVCPEGLSCGPDRVCRAPLADDAAPDAPDAALDAPDAAAPPDAAPALACGDPGDFARGAPRVFTGDTTGALDHVASLCGGLVHSSVDHVYRATAQAGDALDVAIGGDPDGRAYAVLLCDAPPATPACLGDATARPGDPLALTGLPAGDVYVVVDSAAVALSGPYTLTVHLRAP